MTLDGRVQRVARDEAPTRQGVGRPRRSSARADATRRGPLAASRIPETLLEGAYDPPLGPDARYEQTESISLAFVAGLQMLPPRQLAVLVLRDVLGFRADEVAEMLDRERRVHHQCAQTGPSRPAAARPEPAGGHHYRRRSPRSRRARARFVAAYEAADVDARVAPCSPTTSSSQMPPIRSSTSDATRSGSSWGCSSAPATSPWSRPGQRAACLWRVRRRGRRRATRQRPGHRDRHRQRFERAEQVREPSLRLVRAPPVLEPRGLND